MLLSQRSRPQLLLGTAIAHKLCAALADTFLVPGRTQLPKRVVPYLRAVSALGLVLSFYGWRDVIRLPAFDLYLLVALAMCFFALDVIPFRFTSQPVVTTIADLPAIAAAILFPFPIAAFGVFVAKLASEAVARVQSRSRHVHSLNTSLQLCPTAPHNATFFRNFPKKI